MKIEAKVIADSISIVNGKRITTFELQYPRMVHAEVLTHRMFSRNASSSRAIPVSKVIEMVREAPAMPVRFGANQAGMQDKGVEHDQTVLVPLDGPGWLEVPDCIIGSKEQLWRAAANWMAEVSMIYSDNGYHKQVCNRLTEPFQWMKTVVTATEYDNFFWLRRDDDADPTLKALADCMWEALQNSVPFKLFPGEWHVPYVKTLRAFDGRIVYATLNGKEFDDDCFVDLDTNLNYREISMEQALAISSSCSAQISYRKLDNSLEKAEDVYSKLINGRKVHGSPFEHQATPMVKPTEVDDGGWEDGVTHVDREGNFWSGNFCGFIQHRQLITGNVCKSYKGD